MSKTLILYRSKSGFSKGYAELLKKNLDCEMIEYKRFDKKYNDYKTIIYLGGLYIGGINGFKDFKAKIDSKVKVHVIAVGAAPGRKNELEEIKSHNFKDDELNRYSFSFLRGGFDYDKCNKIDKILMSMLKWKLKRIKNPTADQVGLLKSYEKPLSFVSEDKVIQFINEKIKGV